MTQRVSDEDVQRLIAHRPGTPDRIEDAWIKALAEDERDARSEIARLTSVVEAAEMLYAHLRRAIEDIDAHATPLGEDGEPG